MQSPPIELDDARATVLARVRPLPAEVATLADALGRHLAEDVVAPLSLQPFDNSAADGFAVRAADIVTARHSAPVRLSVVSESRAGHPSGATVGSGEAVAISTGAAMPAGADAVVRVEDTHRDGDRILAEAAVARGSDVRRAGEDFAAGTTMLREGTRLGAAELGGLAAIGRERASVRRRPRVAIVTCGDELKSPGRPLGPTEIYDCNAPALAALAHLAGAEVTSVVSVPDQMEATTAALEVALGADLSIACGGVSVGEHDHVKAALALLGVSESFWRLALRPGGPTWFGSRDGALVFGLPGNPASAFVGFLLLVRPALVALGGGDPAERRLRARLGTAYAKRPGRAHAVRCLLEAGDDGWIATPRPQQGSHLLSSLLGADCLAMIPSASGDVAAGTGVEVEPLDQGKVGR